MSTPFADTTTQERAFAAEVAEWCHCLGNTSTAFFTTATAPRATIADIFIAGNSSGAYQLDFASKQLIRALVVESCRRRHELLGEMTGRQAPGIDDQRLVYYPELTDFIALGVCTGIVDYADTPAWDFWTATAVHDGRFCLVSYIPASLRELATQAIDVTPMGSLIWCPVGSLALDPF